jgi:CheY-like chemotaxis protein
VLYVETRPDIREVATLSLEIDPLISVTSFDGGGAALAALDAGLRPDVILLDVMMPGMDGPATLSGIRERSAGLDPVVFITARGSGARAGALPLAGRGGRDHQAVRPHDLACELRALLQTRGRRSSALTP